MGVHRANENFTCPSINGCAVVGADGASFTFTPKPGTGGGISGGVRLLDTDGGSPSTYTQYDTAPPLGPAFYVAQDGGHTNIQVSASRDVSDPQLSVTGDVENIGTGAEGRVLYGSNDGGATLVFVGFIDATTSNNGNNLRIRTTQVDGGNDADTVAGEIDARLPVGYEVWVGDVGDDGSSTSFNSPGSPARTAATTFSLHGAQTGFIEEGDIVTTTAPFSTSTTLI